LVGTVFAADLAGTGLAAAAEGADCAVAVADLADDASRKASVSVSADAGDRYRRSDITKRTAKGLDTKGGS
jgi:hypothetical protein